MLEKDGYVVIRNAISKDVLNFVVDELNIIYEALKDNEQVYNDDTVVGAFSCDYSSTTEALLLNLLDTVEKEVGVEVYPTFSYFRYYDSGQEMYTHVDRPSCEYAITVNLWNENEPWPIWFLHPKGYHAQVDLEPGDIVIYRGCEIPHWREVNTVGKVLQAFLFYVDKNGPNAEWAYDKRQLGEKDVRRR